MFRKQYISILIAVLAAGCSGGNDSETPTDECTPKCDSKTQICVDGVCQDKLSCNPDCTPGYICDNGECKQDKTCFPACDYDNEKCINNTCYQKDECVPGCTEAENCEDGVCVPDPKRCSGKMCKDSTTYCKDGVWMPCDAGEGCHLGVCIEGLAPECQTGQCNDEGTKQCLAGKWSKCGSLDKCVDGECVTQQKDCDSGTCSEDATYRCTNEKKYEKCPVGYLCKEGECVEGYDPNAALLWKLCERNSDCGFGVCVFSLATSRAFDSERLGKTDANEVLVSSLDPRIPEGYGVCSMDCTKDKTVCDSLSEMSGGLAKFTCQVVAVGDSPYPPKDADGAEYSLPFHDYLDTKDMEVAPFSAMCRPTDMTHETYSKTFCESCKKSSECDDNEACVMGMCLPKCSNIEMCPATFECIEESEAGSESKLNVCFPTSGTCGACRDLDCDGQGFGFCDKAGFDCNDFDPDIYYTTELPNVCSDVATDVNCNGYIDRLELIGSAEHCNECSDVCRIDEGAQHFVKSCIKDNGDVELDDTNPETYQFACLQLCEPGWADCNGDLSDGCEVKLVDIEEDEIVVTSDAIRMAVDEDEDGFGNSDPSRHHYCCAKTPESCYAFPFTSQNPGVTWDHAVLTDGVSYVSNDQDCDDTRANVNPEAAEVCDGLDNDCNPGTEDGEGQTLNVYYSETGYDVKKLNEQCTVRNQSTYSTCNEGGKVICHATSAGTYEMKCSGSTSNVESGDQLCNGKDDDCDGLVDEHWVYKKCYYGEENPLSEDDLSLNPDNSINICKLGVMMCKDTGASCEPLYTARPYDYMGDGIDSNCDGYDYDLANAIFIRNYGTGATDGSDNESHTGTANSPFAGLNAKSKYYKDALSLACSLKDTGKTVCRDILVDVLAGQSNETNEANGWAKTDIRIPTVNPDGLYNPGFNAPVAENHTAIIQKLMSIDSETGHTSFNLSALNNTLVPGEVYPPQEAIRIWGGFNVTCNNANCSWVSSTTQSVFNRSVSETSSELSQEKYTLITPKDNSYPLSLALHNLKIAYGTGLPANYNGTTLTGLSCGSKGCRHLTLDNSLINVTAPAGVKHLSFDVSVSDNVIWGTDTYAWTRSNGKLCDGVAAYGKCDFNMVDDYTYNFNHNVCLQALQFGKNDFKWKRYDSRDCFIGSMIFDKDYTTCKYGATTFYDLYNRWCPDGKHSVGGCGAIVTVNRSPNVVKWAGNSGGGKFGGQGARSNDYTSHEGCDTVMVATDWDPYDPRISRRADAGGPGLNKQNGNYVTYDGYTYGKGGRTSDVSLSLLATGNEFYVKSNASLGNGHHGMNGGGGGGGAVYHNYGYNGRASTVIAGGGGTGGCGGRGGLAGGTGGSAIGIAFVSPESGDSYFNLYNKSKVTAAGGSGSEGENGQSGVDGGEGGDGYAWGDEGAADKDLHCQKAISGAPGGKGAGGGGGAGGRAGHAYAYLVACNTKNNAQKLNSKDPAHLSDCKIHVSDAFANQPSAFGASSTAFDGVDGTDGANASISKAGAGGTMGTSNNSGAEKGKSVILHVCNINGTSLSCFN